ncbi:TetR/AcrR family transcriptional regulator [Niveispirillum sp.]|uniref:TetR/AcrR family transcriptional regulator n=1 Tax=Niveispirillum sp. TaxID=1917217 RepID=UPI001B7358A4|nr:TetR/AcrR family transcriptional regulator [Niveispirillum sp.]MBP7338102.1 TetR/AcrR family transcriptional regulator [Niveispirillum sp.]
MDKKASVEKVTAEQGSQPRRRRGPIPKSHAEGGMAEPVRDVILGAAVTEFSEKGFLGTTTRDIASRAGVNHGMVTYYFKSKEALWREATRLIFGRLAAEVMEGVEIPTTRQELRQVAANGIRRFVHYCARHPDYVRFMFHESIQRSDRLSWLAENFLRPAHAAAAMFISRLQEEKLTADIPPVSLLYLIVGGAQVMYVMANEVEAVWGVDPFAEKTIDAHADALIGMVLRDA